MNASKLPEATRDLLFATLLVTEGDSFLGGNLLLLNAAVLERSGPIVLASLAVLVIFYTLARSLGRPAWGLVVTYLLLRIMAYAHQPWLITLV